MKKKHVEGGRERGEKREAGVREGETLLGFR